MYAEVPCQFFEGAYISVMNIFTGLKKNLNQLCAPAIFDGFKQVYLFPQITRFSYLLLCDREWFKPVVKFISIPKYILILFTIPLHHLSIHQTL